MKLLQIYLLLTVMTLRFLLLFFILISSCLSKAQGRMSTNTILGEAVDENGEGVPFANVALFNQDSTLSAGTSTMKKAHLN